MLLKGDSRHPPVQPERQSQLGSADSIEANKTPKGVRQIEKGQHVEAESTGDRIGWVGQQKCPGLIQRPSTRAKNSQVRSSQWIEQRRQARMRVYPKPQECAERCLSNRTTIDREGSSSEEKKQSKWRGSSIRSFS